MGIRGSLIQITPQKLAEFLANPGIAYKQIDTALLKHLKERLMMKPSAKTKGLALKVVKKRTESTVEDEFKVFSLEKGWHMLHHILNGTAENGNGPLANTVLGGKEIPDVDQISDMPMRYLIPVQVKEVAKALAAVDFAKLAKNFDGASAAAQRIYGVPHRLPEHLVELIQDMRKDPGVAKKVQKVRAYREAQIEARLAKLSEEEREQERERRKQNREENKQRMEAFFSPKPMQFSPEDVAAFVEPVRDFYQQAAKSGMAMLLYIR